MINENNIRESSSSFPKGLEEFRQNIKNKDNSSDIYCHNLYLLQTTDRDGNVTGEAYGMNLITNWGFKEIYTISDSYSNYKIYIGNGTDEPVLTNNTLYSPIITTGSVEVNREASIYPFQYDSSAGIITGVQRIYQGYFDYNLSGITENFDITEIGYGKSTTQLISHAKIYDKDGNPSSITKRINERLTINVFWTLNMKESIIETNYDNGVYIVMEPAFSGMLRRSRNGYLYTIYGSQKVGCTESYSNNMYYNVATLLDDNDVKSTIKPNSLLIENQRSYISDIIATDKRKSTMSNYVENITGEFNFMIMTKDKLPTPEELTTYTAYTNNSKSKLFSNLFGLSYNSSTGVGELPCTNFNITSLSMYNHITKEWDIEEEFVTDGDVEYDNMWRSFVRVYVTFNGVNCPVWVYVNTRTDLPITSFNNSNIVLYATDKYWDTSTWELISNLSNVDETLQCKRYYIRTTETNEPSKYILYPYRNMIKNSLISIQDSYVVNKVSAKDFINWICGSGSSTNLHRVHLIALSSDTYGWVLIGRKLVYMNTNDRPTYILSGPYRVPLDRYNQWTTDDYIILSMSSYTSSNNVSIRVYTTTDPLAEPSYIDIPLLFSNITWTFGNNDIMYSFTDVGPGFLVCQRNDNVVDECLILNIHDSENDNSVTQKLLSNVKFCKVIGETTNCVYLKTDDTGSVTFEIYDMLNQNVISTFQLPNNEYTINGLIAWKNYIYITATLSDTKVSFIYIIDECVLKQLLFVIPVDTSTPPNSNGPDTVVTYNSECLVISSNSKSITYIFDNENPMNPIQWNKYITSAILKYVNDNKQLIMLYSTNCKGTYWSYCMNVMDIGYMIDQRKVVDVYPEHYICASTGGYTSGIYGRNYASCLIGTIFNDGVVYSSYSEYKNTTFRDDSLTWVDMPLVLPHKMTGTTTTIQSWNNPKRLQNKEYSFTLTNDTTNWGDDTNV